VVPMLGSVCDIESNRVCSGSWRISGGERVKFSSGELGGGAGSIGESNPLCVLSGGKIEVVL